MIHWMRKHVVGTQLTIGGLWLVLGVVYLAFTVLTDSKYWPLAVIYAVIGVLWFGSAMVLRSRRRREQAASTIDARDSESRNMG
ncbi:hypothetical protein [Leifsonia poae]|uniref:hypothetical protein n=1 Tax=Leifsonia poae TaxID=110933 RepID=UPI003D67BA0D